MNQENTTHILLIEDDQFFSELLSRKLRGRNCLVTEKGSLEAALDALQVEGVHFHAVCFDLVVLGLDGLKKLSELMTSDRLGNTPLLLLTDKEIEAEAATWSPSAALTHLVKTETSPDEIVSRIMSLAGNPRSVYLR